MEYAEMALDLHDELVRAQADPPDFPVLVFRSEGFFIIRTIDKKPDDLKVANLNRAFLSTGHYLCYASFLVKRTIRMSLQLKGVN